MAKPMTAVELADKYGDLYDAVCLLPSKVSVDVDRVLRDFLSHYIHDLQAAVVSNPAWLLDQVQAHLNTIHRAAAKVFSVRELKRGIHREFSAVIGITEMLGNKERLVRVDHQTNAGMGEFTIEVS